MIPCYLKESNEERSTLEDSESSNVGMEENIFSEMKHLTLTLIKF